MPDQGIRLAELVAALSLGIDLGFGQPMEHVLRQCLIALRLAEDAKLDAEARASVYYTALIINVGCHTDAHEQAKWFGDDLALKKDKFTTDMKSLRGMVSGFRKIGTGHAPLHRFRLGLEFVLSGHREVDHMVDHHAKLGRALAEKLALPEPVGEACTAAYERWDGRGWPGKLRGDQIPLPARIAQIAEYVEVANRIGGIAAVRKLARESRAQFDPGMLDRFLVNGDALLDGLDTIAVWDAVIQAEPALGAPLVGEKLTSAITAIADFVDLKSPYFLGHARAVGDLVAEVGLRAGMSAAQIQQLRHAGLLHGLGRLGVSNAILDKRGPLGAGERERVRLQPYFTGRMLRQAESLGAIARIVVQHRERLDGSGYPNGLTGAAISPEARILAAADAYQAMCEPRPHRPALSADAAADTLRAEAKAGRLDAEIVEAVLGAAGHRVARRREGPSGLTVREVEVLRHLARGLSNKEIAAALFISAKTVANHIEHIYEKINASNRAAAGLFAMQNGLLPEQEFPARSWA